MRESEAELRALAEHGFKPDAAAMQLDNAFHGCESHPGTPSEFVAAVQSAKHLKYAVSVRRIDADSIVADSNYRERFRFNSVSLFRSDFNQFFRFIVVLEGVRN